MKDLSRYHEHAAQKNVFRIWEYQPSDFHKGLRAFLLFCLIFSMVIFADFFLPRKEKTETITDWRAQSQLADLRQGDPRINNLHALEPLDFRIYTKSSTTALKKEDADLLRIGDDITIIKTFLFGTTTSLKLSTGKIIHPFMDFYSWLLFIPVCLTLFSLIALFRPLKTENMTSLAVLNILLLAAFVALRLFYL